MEHLVLTGYLSSCYIWFLFILTTTYKLALSTLKLVGGSPELGTELCLTHSIIFCSGTLPFL